MPELPDIRLYTEALRERIAGTRFESLTCHSPFVLRTVEPAAADLAGLTVVDVTHVGKRLAIGLDEDSWIVMHLMIAGRLHWHDRGPKKRRAARVATFKFASGELVLTEAGSRKRAAIELHRVGDIRARIDRGGLDPLACDLDAFVARLSRTNHTLKRALTDQRLLTGIGNAYSDEILHRAGLSPVRQTRTLAAADWSRLHAATRAVLGEWSTRLASQVGDRWPEKVTAFRPEMAVHGRYGQPCPVCSTSVQRIRYKHNETNYCPRCQTGGRLLRDRSLSRLLKSDWPKTIDELER